MEKSFPIDLFSLFITRPTISKWATYTNQHFRIHGKSDEDTSVDELFAYLGVRIFMSIVHLPEVHDYFTKELGMTFVTERFSRDRFYSLNTNFCITDPSVDGVDLNNPIGMCSELMLFLNKKFPEHFTPSQHLTFDETMVAYKGYSPIRQYIPSKPHKFGFKVWCLSSSCYLLQFSLYEGADDTIHKQSKTHSLVVSFMLPYHRKNHILYIDNLFSSPVLMDELAGFGIAVCGSVRLNRSGMPPDTQINKSVLKSMKHGETKYYQKDNVNLLLWKDQNVLKLVFNHVDIGTIRATVDRWLSGGRRIKMFVHPAVIQYFKHARYVDVINQLHYSYPLNRQTTRSCTPMIWWLIDMCIVNSFILYRTMHPKAKHLDFRKELMTILVSKYIRASVTSRKRPAPVDDVAIAAEHYSMSSGVRGDCVYCKSQSHTRSRVLYICAKCRVYLCVGDCFSAYHTTR